MTVEDKILEYLDGSLGEHESAELLETLAVSPEKRELLEEHLRLKDILALGRKPYSVPLATERALAERLPILSRPYITPVPVGFRTALLGIRQWVGSRAVQTAMGVAAILAISAVSWFAMRPTTQELQVGVQQSFSANEQSANGQKDLRDANDAHTVATNSAKTPSSLTQSAATPSALTQSSAIHSALTQSAATPSALTQSAAMPSTITQSATTPSAIDDEQAIHPVTNFSQNDVAIPHQSGASTLSEIESGNVESRNPVTIGVHYAADKSYLPQSAAIAAQSPINGQYSFTLDCDISDNFAIGLEAGREVYASLNEQSGDYIGSTYSRIIYASSIAATQTNYFCLTAHYTIAPESGYPFRIGLEAGMASTGQPTALATAGISRVLSENLLLDLDAVFSGVWGLTPPSSISEPASGGVEGIVRQDASQQKTFTSGAGIRAGIRFRL
jgi:hypothetical protein